ncbi:MAG: DUF2225 domain-containing protein [Clostridia bacterium]|nr:DUF2225 domain-containing protein [Clostridia bacterium]
MATLGCKTRGNTSPQGKPRVYFCCHPADFSLYFEGVAEELLSRQSCALFYHTAGAVTVTEDLLADLAGMQLFVMPVTTRLLTTENPAKDVLVPFALAHHLPVLPLIQEPGLAALFDKTFGNLQYLDRLDSDPTAIPYEEKLTLYLDSVLVGDELAAQVRAAFDAYIFLSYRKKDRRHAQELMRLIHANEFCRDIAIWYDEFLIPGEDWSDAIRQALEKSGLFVLAVTPNLVNEPNYIQAIEYPMAVEQGKLILPAEMIPTDRLALASRYAGIPPCADAHDPLALSAALAATLRQLAIRGNDNEPQHNFFIGLAYLSGIDVEVDHARAEKLIAGAAEAGLKDAMKKLASMYREGMGVARDYDRAIHWQKRLADAWEADYAEAENKENAPSGYELVEALCSLGDLLTAASRLDEAEAVFLRLEVVVKTLNGKDNWNVFFLIGLSSFKLGYMRYLAGDHEKAEQLFNAADTWLGFARGSWVTQGCMCQIQLCLCMGDIRRRTGRLEEALDRYIKGLAYLQKRLAEEEVAAPLQDLLAKAYAGLGEVCYSAGDPTLALKWYKWGLPLRRTLVSESDRPEYRQALEEHLADMERIQQAPTGSAVYPVLVYAHVYTAERYEEAGQQPEALTHYERAATLYWMLRRELGPLQKHSDSFQLEKACSRLSKLYRERGDSQTAIRWYLECADLQKSWPNKRKYADTCYELGSLYRKLGSRSIALDWYGKALPYWQEQVKTASKIADVYGLSVLQYAIGTLYEEGENPQMAQKWLEKCVRLRQLCVDKKPDSARYREGLEKACRRQGDCAQRLGDACREQGNRPEAKEQYERAIAAYDRLYRLCSQPTYGKKLARCYLCLALVWGNGWQDVIRYQALPLLEKLRQAYPEDSDFVTMYEGAVKSL